METLAQAVDLAVSVDCDAKLKAEATEYCNSFRQAPEAWQVCLTAVDGSFACSE